MFFVAAYGEPVLRRRRRTRNCDAVRSFPRCRARSAPQSELFSRNATGLMLTLPWMRRDGAAHLTRSREAGRRTIGRKFKATGFAQSDAERQTQRATLPEKMVDGHIDLQRAVARAVTLFVVRERLRLLRSPQKQAASASTSTPSMKSVDCPRNYKSHSRRSALITPGNEPIFKTANRNCVSVRH